MDVLSQTRKTELTGEFKEFYTCAVCKNQFSRGSGQTATGVDNSLYYYQSHQESMDMDTGFSAKAEIQTDVDANADHIDGTVQFLHETTGAELRAGPLSDHTFYADEAVGTQLNDFFTRPIKIFSGRWDEISPGIDLYNIKPWDLFFNDVRVKKKLDNFAFINCKLVLRFAINASPFYYGALKASYTPLSGYGVGNLDATSLPARKIIRSQRYTVDLNPQEGSTAIMELPFVHFKNWLRADLRSEFQNMGELYLTQYAALRSANGVTGAGVDISIFAHAEDVHLSGPTTSLALQSRQIRQNSRPNGWLSGPASAVAAAAGALTSIPAIAPLARATDMVASSVSSVAQIFGFTNEPVISDVMPFKNLPFGNFSTGEISEPTQKLTVDPKQEQALDTRVGGFDGVDELTISQLAQKESWLAGTLWTTAYTSDTILWTNVVAPSYHDEAVITGGRKIYATPVTHIAQMFKYWRGDIIYRFKFIKSQFHRGRVRITWDPIADPTSDVNSLNTTFTQIVDLEQQDEIEIRVPYISDFPFLKVPSNYPKTWENGTTPALTFNSDFHNGILQMRVVNNLTAPEATSDIDVLVYVRAADNFEFAVPHDVDTDNSFYALQSVQQPIMASAQTHESNKDQALINFGERFVSLRDLMHRTSLTRSEAVPTPIVAGDKTIYRYRFSRLPVGVGYDPNGINTALSLLGAGNKPYNFTTNHPIAWLRTMFIGHRGSVTYNVNLDLEGSGVSSAGTLSIERRIEGSTAVGLVASNIATAVTTSAWSKSAASSGVRSNGAGGMALVNQRTQTGLSALLPQYTRSRFFVNDLSTDVTGKATDDSDYDVWEVSWILKASSTANATNGILNLYACSGPDFNLVGFLSTPVVYKMTATPAAA